MVVLGLFSASLSLNKPRATDSSNTAPLRVSNILAPLLLITKQPARSCGWWCRSLTRLILRNIIKIFGVQQGVGTFSKGAIWAAYLAGAVRSIHNWSVAQGGLCIYAIYSGVMHSHLFTAHGWKFGAAAVFLFLVVKLNSHTVSTSIGGLRSKLSTYSSVYSVVYSPSGHGSDINGFIPEGTSLHEYCERYHWEPFMPRVQRRKIFDLILVNTELEWLEIRMGEMASEVDFFVVVESSTTFSDTPKPLYVRESWD